MRLAVDRDHDRSAMPGVAELRRAPTDPAGAGPSERLIPAPHGFVPDSWLARGAPIPFHHSPASDVERPAIQGYRDNAEGDR